MPTSAPPPTPAPPADRPGWRQALTALGDRRVAVMFFLGVSAGLPLLLIFSSLSLWLREAGVERSAVTFFSWAALGYSFKFVWAPLIDRLPLPGLTRVLGRRRAWILVSQLAVMAAIAAMALVDPAAGGTALARMGLAAAALGFAAATQDIVIDAFRIECATPRLQATLSSAYIAGYRVGMVLSGAGALYLAAWFLSSMENYVYEAWRWTYLLMAGAMSIGLVTTLLAREPAAGAGHRPSDAQTPQHARLLLVFALTVAVFVSAFFYGGTLLGAAPGRGPLLGFLLEALRFALATGAALLSGWVLVRLGLVDRRTARRTWLAPVLEFFQRHGARTALTVLALIGLYRVSDIVLGVIANVFYQDLGFSKTEIAEAVKSFGVVVGIAGGFLGGVLATRFGVMPILMLGALLSALTNLIFIGLALAGHDLPLLYLTVAADNLAAGLASAAFVAFLSSLTSVSFTAVQYAIFSSLMTLMPKVLGGYSGSMVSAMGYPAFFLFTTLIGIPVLALVWLAGRQLAAGDQPGRERAGQGGDLPVGGS